MSELLKTKVAIVTGAGRGIGRAISIALAGQAATVVLASRSIEKLEETAELVTSAGGKHEIVSTELTDEDSIKNLVKVTGGKFGRLDILINNAGVTHSAKLEETATKDWDRCFAVAHAGATKLIVLTMTNLIQPNAITIKLSANKINPTIHTDTINIK